MASNKTPENDGLSKEFHLAFFDLLGPKLLECLNKVFSLGEFSTSQRQAVVTLVEKRVEINDTLKIGDLSHCLMLMSK